MEVKHMERIKRFFRDDAATAEATSTVLMVAAVAILLAGALGVYYNAFSGFFGAVGGAVDTEAGKIPSSWP
jgi:hypothetical protein